MVMRSLFAVFASSVLCSSAATGQTNTSSATVTVIDTDSALATGSANLSVTTVSITANRLAWDPRFQKIYLSLPSAAGSNGNAVQVLDPVTGGLGANVFAGSEPNLLAVSSTSKYLYVGLNGSSTVQRLTLPTLETDVKIVLGNDSFFGPFFASDLQASPASDATVAVVRSVQNTSPAEEGGVVIYDDASARPNALCGFAEGACTGNTLRGLFNSIQWNADASMMFAANNEDTGFDFYTLPVTVSGFEGGTDYGALAGGFGAAIHFDRVTKYVYDDNDRSLTPSPGRGSEHSMLLD